MPAEVLRGLQSPAQWLHVRRLCAEGELTMSVSSPGGRGRREPAAAERAGDEPDEAAYSELIRRLSFAYPHQAAEKLPSKVTATELKAGAFEPDAEGRP
jgi:hypothetical protein